MFWVTRFFFYILLKKIEKRCNSLLKCASIHGNTEERLCWRIWPPLFFSTAWTLLVSRLQECFSRLLERHSKLFFGPWLPFSLFSVIMIPHCFNNVEFWGGQSMTDSVPLCAFLSRYVFTALAKKWSHCRLWTRSLIIFDSKNVKNYIIEAKYNKSWVAQHLCTLLYN